MRENAKEIECSYKKGQMKDHQVPRQHVPRTLIESLRRQQRATVKVVFVLCKQ